jgi:hypothetical protein
MKNLPTFLSVLGLFLLAQLSAAAAKEQPEDKLLATFLVAVKTKDYALLKKISTLTVGFNSKKFMETAADYGRFLEKPYHIKPNDEPRKAWEIRKGFPDLSLRFWKVLPQEAEPFWVALAVQNNMNVYKINGYIMVPNEPPLPEAEP